MDEREQESQGRRRGKQARDDSFRIKTRAACHQNERKRGNENSEHNYGELRTRKVWDATLSRSRKRVRSDITRKPACT